MKKYILLIAILFTAGFAQTDYFNQSGNPKYGVFIGTNASSIYSTSLKNIIYKMGLNGGFVSVRKISDNMHLRLEVHYINKGYKTKRVKDAEYIKKKQRYYFITEYIDLPILMQFNMPIQHYDFNWMIGVAPSINLTTRQKTKIDDDVTTHSIDDKNRLFDVNLVVGSNMMLNNHMNLDFRASAGLLPINKQGDFWGSRNISFLLALGYFF